MRILGIDPGIATVGFGFVDQACGCALRPVQYGAITTEAGLPLATRLVQINRDLEELIETFRPDVLSVEELFFNTNITTVMDMTRRLLKLNCIPRPDDAADALALAICHARSATSLLRQNPLAKPTV